MTCDVVEIYEWQTLCEVPRYATQRRTIHTYLFVSSRMWLEDCPGSWVDRQWPIDVPELKMGRKWFSYWFFLFLGAEALIISANHWIPGVVFRKVRVTMSLKRAIYLDEQDCFTLESTLLDYLLIFWSQGSWHRHKRRPNSTLAKLIHLEVTRFSIRAR